MLLESTGYNRANREPETFDLAQTMEALLAVPGKLRVATVATAYIDVAALSTFLNYIAGKADGRSGADVELFIERNSAVRLCAEVMDKEADKAGKKLRKAFRNGLFGAVRLKVYAVQAGALFHSKAIYIKTNSHHRVAVGSLNLTANGLVKNEELVVTTSADLGRSTLRGHFIKEVEQYISKAHFEKIGGRVVPISNILQNPFKSRDISNLRDVLLGGVIWYERKEVEAFAFPLHLPEELRKARAMIGETSIPHLQSTLDSSLPVLPLMGSRFEMEAVERSRWRRRLCIPTCYGLWSPPEWRKEIESGHTDRSRPRHEHLKVLQERFQAKDRSSIVKSIVGACEEIWTALSQVDVQGEKVSLPTDLRERAEKWVKRISDKLRDPKYLDFLATGLSPVDVPDVWSGNSSDAAEFENSFLESVRFELNRQRPRSLLAQRLSEGEYRGLIDSDTDLRKILVERANSLFRPNDKSEDHLGDDDEADD